MTKEDFKILYNNYFDPVRNYLYYRSTNAELATDIAQEVFLKLWEKREKLQKEKIKGLLFKMASDEFVSGFRRNKLEMEFSQSFRFELIEESPEEEFKYKELKDNYEKALVALPEKQRVVFLMSRMEGLKYHEIAERLQLSVKAVEKRMNYALKYLKNALDY